MIPSNSLTSTPAFVTTSSATLLGGADQFTLNGSNTVTAYSPALFIYAAAGSDASVHLYGLSVSNTSTPPTPTQISNLSVSAIEKLCDFGAAQTTLTDPTTLFVVLHIAGATGCNSTGDVYEVVHYTDSSSTAPAPVSITTTQFTPLYLSSGALGGLVLLDATGHNLYFYASNRFTSPATLASGVSTYSYVYGALIGNQTQFGTGAVFLSVTSGATSYLYRVTASGTSSNVYTAAGSLGVGVGDDSNVYFTDTTGGTTPTVSIYQESLSGAGAPLKLYGATYAAGTTTYNLVGSNGSVLVFDSSSIGINPTSSLMTVPIGQTSTSAATIGSTYTGRISVSMLAPTIDNPPADVLFVTVANTSITGAAQTVSYSSEILTPNGTVQQALLANSIFQNRTSAVSSSVLQIKGITDTGGGYGGGTVYSVNIGNLAATAFTTTGGAAYTVPATYVAGLSGLSNTIGGGDLFGAGSGGTTNSGVAYDLTQFMLVPVSLANTNVSLL